MSILPWEPEVILHPDTGEQESICGDHVPLVPVYVPVFSGAQAAQPAATTRQLYSDRGAGRTHRRHTLYDGNIQSYKVTQVYCNLQGDTKIHHM